jgi:uncharacterized protein
MLYNVSSLLKEHTGSSREHDIDDDVQIDGERRHVTGHARLDRTPRGILVRATLAGAMPGQCSRCLRPIETPVAFSIEEEFLPTIDVTTGVRIPAEEGEDDAYRIDARHMLDLREPARQYWAMSLPMAPACEGGCSGICARCGKEETADHPCVEQPADERWAKLAELRDA